MEEQFRLLLKKLDKMKEEINEKMTDNQVEINENIITIKTDSAQNLEKKMNEKITDNLGDMREEIKKDTKEIIDDKLATIEGKTEAVGKKIELDEKILNVAKYMIMQIVGMFQTVVKDMNLQMEERVEKVKNKIEENVVKTLEK